MQQFPIPEKRPKAKVVKPIRYYLLRHGETEYSQAGRYSGWEDARLTDTGLEQHQTMAAALAHTDLAVIYTSDSYRCIHLAQAVAKSRKVGLHKRKGLRELNFGAFGGKTYGEAAAEHPQALARWVAEPVRNAPPHGETLERLWERLLPVLQEVKSEVQELPSTDSICVPVAIVTHGGPIRALLCQWLGIPLPYQWQFRIDPGSLTVVEQYEEGAICCSVNWRPGCLSALEMR
ncbi:MAG: histidine phosphatase family protein [Firmicutes bacterium]|nr:histidine phosphatase family protein [Bacillota bacterium]